MLRRKLGLGNLVPMAYFALNFPPRTGLAWPRFTGKTRGPLAARAVHSARGARRAESMGGDRIATITRGAGGEGGVMSGYAMTTSDAFVWRVGRGEVTLSRAGDAWMVSYTSVGRLLGPRQLLYENRHRDPTHAAWDVMARVVLASRDEDEGLRAGRSAAQWLRAWPNQRAFSGSPDNGGENGTR